MSYVVLARKWRPQSFDDLVGQEHVSTTLANAIAKDRVAHAFLFTGVRGVGKTTSARILAKTLNCEKGPTAKPCLTCAACKEIAAGTDVDVQEIDGASYNGVDEVRRLQETLPYRPQRDRFKIYIVDEVHMLSNAAWNAFLKTLEEPPPHVKFIFATTEVHKVPITILSRCQRYDFKLLTAVDTAARLRFVLESEGIPFEDAALSILAREAAGSMRDGMSLLDQVIAWVGTGGDTLTAEGVARVLGVAARSVLHGLAAALIDGDAAACLRIIADLAEQGYDLPHVARDFLHHLRDVVVAKAADDTKRLIDLPDAELADVKALAARTTLDDLSRLHLGFSRSFDDVVRSGQPRAALEMTLVRLARRPALASLDELLARLADLERRLGGGPSGGPAGGGPAARGGAPPAPGGRVGGPPARGSYSAPFEAPQAVSTAPTPPAPATAPASSRPPQVSAAPAPRVEAPPATFVAPQTISTPAAPPPPRAPTAAPPQAASGEASSTEGAKATGAVMTPVLSKTSPAWTDYRAIVAKVRAQRPSFASVLERAVLLDFGPERVVLGYGVGSFLASQVNDPTSRQDFTTAVRAHFGRPTEVAVEVRPLPEGAPTLAGIESDARRAEVEAHRRAVSGHPLVTAAIELLGAELKDVRLSAAYADAR